MAGKKKVLIICLDGFTWRMGHGFFAEGVMPVLAEMAEGGCRGDLESVMPFETGPAWSSFQTGCYPGKTGVFAFHTFDREMGSARLNSFDDICVPSIWELAHRAGRKIVSINLPVTSPPPEVDGVIIPGLLCPGLSEKTTHPSEVWEKYIRPRKDYLIVNNAHRATVAETIEQAVATERIRRDVALEIAGDVDWDIFCFEMQSGDLLQHRIWWALDPAAEGFSQSDRAKALEYYKCCDDIVADLVKLAGPETLTVVVSDHGFCNFRGGVHVNVWLREHGYLKLPPERPPTRWDNFKSRVPPVKKMAGLAGGCGRWARNQLDDVISVLTGKAKKTAYSEIELLHLRQLVDFERTEAFCLGSMGGMLYVNAEGERREQLCRMIAEQLLHDLGPQSNHPVISSVLVAEEVYGKSRPVAAMPDLVIEFEAGYSQIINPLGDAVLTGHEPGTKQKGTHDRNGILVVSGGGVKKGMELNARIVDIAPTVLAYMGIAVPEHMDGKVLSEAFLQAPAVNYEKVDYAGTSSAEYTDEEQAEVEKHLSDLGYL